MEASTARGSVSGPIEADGPDLEALYEAGLVQHAQPGRFDGVIRALAVDPRAHSPIALAMRRGRLVAPGEATDDLGGSVPAASEDGRFESLHGRDLSPFSMPCWGS